MSSLKPNIPHPTTADFLIAALRNRGVPFLATLCGHGLDPLFHAARKAGMPLIDTRNEQTAAYIADAYGRLTRTPGVCAVSSGVAVVNALTGVANSWFDQSPMLLLSGAADTTTAGHGHFQDMDQAAVAAPVTRFSQTILTPAELPRLLDEAWSHLPAHLMFPMDIQRAPFTAAPTPPPEPPQPASANHDEIQAALDRASQPLVIAGSGAFYDRSGPALVRFCETHHIPFVTPIWDRGICDHPSPAFMGVIGAATGGPQILPDSDCLILAGAVPDYRIGYAKGPHVHQFTGDWQSLRAAPKNIWLDECRRRRDAFRDTFQAQPNPTIHIIHSIRQVLPQDPVLLIDGGTIGQWAHQLLCFDRYPSHWLTCGRSGVVGWGIGGAMAARLAFPHRPVLLLSGDGSFTFNVADLESAVRQKLPFVALIADDQSWGITKAGHIRQFGEPIASTLGPIDFVKLAESLGARGLRPESSDQLTQQLRQALARPEVTVIHVPTTSA